MDHAVNFPEVSIKNKVVSSHYHCKDAVLVQVKNGIDTLRFNGLLYSGHQVTLNGESIFSVNEEEFCPTCGGYLCRGYGEQNLSMKDAMKISEKLNGKYTGIENAIKNMSPLLGLLRDGDYIVADYELFPYVYGEHFWEYTQIPGLFTARYGWMGMNMYHVVTRPDHLIPSERASLCNAERVDFYMEHFENDEFYPRAIGLWVSGNTVLLLDGHHKVTASAAQGKMAKCLVIFPAEIENNQKKTKVMLQDDKYLFDAAGNRIGYARGFFDSRRVYFSEEGTIGEMPDDLDWGKIPEKYQLQQKTYEKIPKDAFEYEIFDNIRNAKEEFGLAMHYLRKKEKLSRVDVMMYLKWHQVLKQTWSKKVKNAYPKNWMDTKIMTALNEAGYQFGWEKEPKTANLFSEVFSFLEGQTTIDKIPDVLGNKLENEKITTVLIPKTVKYVNRNVFIKFPDLDRIVVQEGNPYLKSEDFEDVLVKAKERRMKKKMKQEQAKHLYYHPFSELDELLKNCHLSGDQPRK